MISLESLILLLVVAGLAFYAGMQFGRQQALAADRGQVDSQDQTDMSQSASRGPVAAPSKPAAPRGAPPPASAGSGSNAGATSASAGAAPRRSTPPPPASAALVHPTDKPKS